MEELWNTELTTLQQKIKQLHNENQKLIAEHKKFKISSLDNLAGSLYAEEYKLNEDLKDHVARLQVELKLKEKELEGKNGEIQHLHEEVEFLRIEQNQMRRRSRVMETQVKSLYEEREEILADMKEKSFVILRDHLGMAQMENEDLAWRQMNDPMRPRFTLNEMNSLLEERNALAKRVDDLEDELVGFKMERLIEINMRSRRSEERVEVVVEKPSIWTNLWVFLTALNWEILYSAELNCNSATVNFDFFENLKVLNAAELIYVLFSSAELKKFIIQLSWIAKQNGLYPWKLILFLIFRWSKISSPFTVSNHDWTVDELLKLSSTTGFLHQTPIWKSIVS